MVSPLTAPVASASKARFTVKGARVGVDVLVVPLRVVVGLYW